MRWMLSALLPAAIIVAGAAGAGASDTAGAPDEEDRLRRDCLQHIDLSQYLDRAFGEGRIALAEMENGHRMELFASERGTWTMVELLPNGFACVTASGSGLSVEQGVRPAS